MMKPVSFKTASYGFMHLNKFVEGLDLNATLGLPKLWFADVEGEVYKCTGSTEFCEKFNSAFNFNLDPKHSFLSGKRVTFYFTDENTVEPEVETTVEESRSDVEEALPVEEVAVKEEAVAEEVEESTEVQESEVVDWEYVATLENTKEGKLELDKYAEKFDVALKRNKTIENMIIDFKKALDVE